MARQRSPAGLEDLPDELRVMILHVVPNVDTLRSLRLASQVYYETSCTEKDSIFTSLAVRHLGDLDFDVYQMSKITMLQIYAGADIDRDRGSVFLALGELNTEVRTSKRIFLPTSECLALLRIKHLVAWWVEERDDAKHIMTSPNMRVGGKLSFPFPMGEYFIFCVDDPKDHIEKIMEAYAEHWSSVRDEESDDGSGDDHIAGQIGDELPLGPT